MAFLAAHPTHIAWLFRMYLINEDVARLVDPRYVDQVVKYIQNIRPLIRPVYEADLAKMPSIVMASSQAENIQFLGDQGVQYEQTELPPFQIVNFDAYEYDGDTLKTYEKSLCYKTWPNLWAVSGPFKSQILQMFPEDDHIVVTLKDPIPAGTPMRGWTVESAERTETYMLGASVDDVSSTITLSTAGDHGIHRLMAVVMRWVLKSGRPFLDRQGLQVSRVTQHPTVLADNEQMIWQTVFALESKTTDHWIASDAIIDESERGLVDVIPTH
jgi:hypothetical protein